ncbi:hypothetical protein U3516DRAFT_767423 [Neocallimastix sp. 'constans']
MFNCYTGTASTLATPHKQRNSSIETLYAILKGKHSPTIGHLFAYSEELVPNFGFTV